VSRVAPRENLICNFRAPDRVTFSVWQDFKQWAQDHGLDICFLTLSLCQGFLRSVRSVDDLTLVPTSTKIVQIRQANTFVYGVDKPRREPFALNCSREGSSRTIIRLAWEGYIMEKARSLPRSFSYRDFLELGHDTFRRSVLRLKRDGRILALEPRTNPRFYVVVESENNRVKPWFTGDSQLDWFLEKVRHNVDGLVCVGGE